MNKEIDISQLPAPDVVEQISYEAILKSGLDDFHARMQEIGSDYVVLESDPAYKLAEVFAYREMLVRLDSNEQAKAVLLAYAQNKDLDHKAAERNLERKTITEATSTSEAILETDISLRRRVQMAPESYTTAGSEGSYIFHGINADPRVKDIFAYAPLDAEGFPRGICNIYVLSNEGEGNSPEDLIAIVNNALNQKIVRPLTDYVNVFSASVLHYQIKAEIEVEQGPDANVILQSTYEEIKKYTANVHAFGSAPSLSGIYQALHRPGVNKVNLISPTANISTQLGQVAYCTSYDLAQVEI